MPAASSDGNSDVKSLMFSLAGILGHMQFQDVIQQRLGQVFDALRDLSERVLLSSDGSPRTKSLLDLMECQRKRYVMESQRRVHVGMDADKPLPLDEPARIELF